MKLLVSVAYVTSALFEIPRVDRERRDICRRRKSGREKSKENFLARSNDLRNDSAFGRDAVVAETHLSSSRMFLDSKDRTRDFHAVCTKRVIIIVRVPT